MEKRCQPSEPALMRRRRCFFSGRNLNLLIPAPSLHGAPVVTLLQSKVIFPLIRLLLDTPAPITVWSCSTVSTSTIPNLDDRATHISAHDILDNVEVLAVIPVRDEYGTEIDIFLLRFGEVIRTMNDHGPEHAGRILGAVMRVPPLHSLVSSPHSPADRILTEVP